jgi:hypothetical protein
MMPQREYGNCDEQQIERDEKQSDQQREPPSETTGSEPALQTLKPFAQIPDRWFFAPCRWFFRHSYPSSSLCVEQRGAKKMSLFDFLLLFQILDLTPLLLDLPLLTFDLGLGLLRLHFLILQSVAYEKAAACPQCTSNSSTRSRCADRGADYGASRGTSHRADSCTFFPRA